MIKKVFLPIIWFAVVFLDSCQKDKSDIINIDAADILVAKTWYDFQNLNESLIKSDKLAKGIKIKAEPKWELAKVNRRSNYQKDVEIPLDFDIEFVLTSQECYNEYKVTQDKRLITSETKLIIEFNNDSIFGFLLTLIPDKEYRISRNFSYKPLPYKKWNDFSGAILYHRLDGSFANGWKLIDGKVVGSIIRLNSKIPIELSKSCQHLYWVTGYWTCPPGTVITKGIQECWTFLHGEYMYTVCDGIIVNNPGGSSNDVNYGGDGGYISSMISPCMGDPIAGMSIAPTSSEASATTGMYGCVRPVLFDDCAPLMKFHGGIDIACDPGTPVYSMRPGVVIDLENGMAADSAGNLTSRGKLGNFVTIRFTNTNGSTEDITYAHLNQVNVSINCQISINESIGLSGRTGNAQNVDNPHVHIQIFLNGARTNPTGYFASYISSSGTIDSPCNPY